MEWVTPNVNIIAHTTQMNLGAEKWITDLGFNVESLDSNNQLSDIEEIVAWAGKRCYLSFELGVNPNLSRIRSDWVNYFDNLLQSGHGSVLEHVSITFAIENVSRVFTGEMNRHRAGVAISEGSMRYISFDNGIKMVETPNMLPEVKAIIEPCVDNIYETYKELFELYDLGDFKRRKELTSLFRRILPMGIATGGLWTINLRALRHILTLRGSEHAEEEIRYVSILMAMEAGKLLKVGLSDFQSHCDGLVCKYIKV